MFSMLSLFVFDVVDGFKQYVTNLLGLQNVNNRIEFPSSEPSSSTTSQTISPNKHRPPTLSLTEETEDYLNLNSRNMKMKHPFNRWSFISRTGKGLINNNMDTKDAVDNRSRSFSSLAYSPEIESIELDDRCNRGGDPTTDIYGHLFSPIPLEQDTFCDFCNKPIYGLGWGPVCQRCAGCHMTCHWLCRDHIRVYCQRSLLTESVSTNKGMLVSEKDLPYTEYNGSHLDNTICPDLEELSLSKKERSNAFQTLSTIESVESRTLSSHSASVADLRPASSDALGTLKVAHSASTTLIPEQVAHISLVKKQQAQEFVRPNRLHKYDQQLPGQDLLPQANERRASEFSLFDGIHKARGKNPGVQGTAYSTASCDLQDDFEKMTIKQPSSSPHGSPKISEPLNFTTSTDANQNMSPDFLTPRSSLLKKHASEVGQLRRPKKVHLVARHSFLAGQGSDATIYSRLSYDFSSLDKEAIRTHGIRVHELTPNNFSLHHPVSASTSPKHPPLPPKRKSSLLRPNNSSKASSAETTNRPELGFASVMQTTEAFVKSRPKHSKRSVIIPVSPLPLTSVVVGPRGRLPYAPDELSKHVSVFNTNDFGLQAHVHSNLPVGDCQGQVRIHINLLRPIRMLLRPRPASIFDIVGKENEADEEYANDFAWDSSDSPEATEQTQCGFPRSAVTSHATAFSANCAAAPAPSWQQAAENAMDFRRQPKSSMFWVPRGSTKLLHVCLSTTAQKVISTLLDRFQIEDNPQKFALYEHTIEGEQEVSVRKLFDDESPLGLLLRWAEEGPERFNQLLGVKRLVLQENETGDIEWSGFSLPELTIFLGILNQEEADYRRRIEMKFEVRQKEILRLMSLYEQQNGSSSVDTTLTASTMLRRDETDSDMQAHNKQQSIPSGMSDSLSTPVSPVLRVRNDAAGPGNRTSSNDDVALLDLDGPAYPSSGTSPTHNPTPGSSSTLPRQFGANDRLKSTLFKPSAYKRIKKAERAQQKRLAKLEREQAKAEKKRVKAKEKLTQQSTGTHHHKWLSGLSAVFSPSSASDDRSTLKS